MNDRDEYVEDKLYSKLKSRIATLYISIKEDLFENKKSASTEIINELEKNIESEYLNFQFCLKSLKNVENKSTKIDTKIFEENLGNSMRFILENLIVFVCKKYSITLPSNLFNLPEEKNMKIFKNSNLIANAIELTPKEFHKLFKILNEFMGHKKFEEFSEYLIKNIENFFLKAKLDKKSEKNLIYLHKYHAKEGLKSSKEDLKSSFYYLLVYILLENGQFFLTANDDKYTIILALISEEIVNNEELKKNLRDGINCFHFLKENKEKNEDKEELEKIKEFEEIFLKIKSIYKF